MQLRDEIEEIRGGGGVELSGDLIGQEDCRTGQEDRRQCCSLLLAAGKLGWAVTSTFAKPDPGERRFDHCRVDRATGESRRQPHVLDEVEERHEVVALEDDTDRRPAQADPLAFVGTREIDAGDDDLACGRSIRTSQQVQERRLARSRATHQRHELTRRNLEVDTPQRDCLDIDLAIDLDDVDQADDRSVARSAGDRVPRNLRGELRWGDGSARCHPTRHLHLKLSIIWRKASTLSTPSGVERLTVASWLVPGT